MNNAVIIDIDGSVREVEIDFDTFGSVENSAGFGTMEPIISNRIDRFGQRIHISMMAFYDDSGFLNNKDNNELACYITGYGHLPSSLLLCRREELYANCRLTKKEIENVLEAIEEAKEELKNQKEIEVGEEYYDIAVHFHRKSYDGNGELVSERIIDAIWDIEHDERVTITGLERFLSIENLDKERGKADIHFLSVALNEERELTLSEGKEQRLRIKNETLEFDFFFLLQKHVKTDTPPFHHLALRFAVLGEFSFEEEVTEEVFDLDKNPSKVFVGGEWGYVYLKDFAEDYLCLHHPWDPFTPYFGVSKSLGGRNFMRQKEGEDWVYYDLTYKLID